VNRLESLNPGTTFFKKSNFTKKNSKNPIAMPFFILYSLSKYFKKSVMGGGEDFLCKTIS
jgi:hypothetical protein